MLISIFLGLSQILIILVMVYRLSNIRYREYLDYNDLDSDIRDISYFNRYNITLMIQLFVSISLVVIAHFSISPDNIIMSQCALLAIQIFVFGQVMSLIVNQEQLALKKKIVKEDKEYLKELKQRLCDMK